MDDQLEYIFNPRSIAIAGASRNPNSIGRLLLRNIINFGYEGNVYPIHPKAEEIGSLPAYKRLTDIPEDVDMVISIIKRDYVIQLIEDARKKGVKSMIIITAGFKEIDEEGEELENKVKELAKEAGIRVVGPNSMGIINGYGLKVNASFTPVEPVAGGISFISQSGAIGAVLMGYAKEYGLGFSKFVSVGNKMDINISHLLPYMERDDNTRVISCYLESFSDPLNFAKIARKTSMSKPVIMVKSGRTDRGSVAASSHTGALASSDIIVDSVLRKSGVIRVDSIKDLIDTSLIFLKTPLPKGRRVAVISNAGGPGTLATDSLINYGLIVEDPLDKTKEVLKSFLPLEASVDNPVDILPSAGIDGYKRSVETLLADENIDMALVIMLPPVLTSIDELFIVIDEVAKNADKPVIGCFMGDNGEISKYTELSYPVFEYPETAAKMMNYLVEYAEWKNKIYDEKLYEVSAEIREKVDRIISDAKSRDNMLLQNEIEQIFTLYGFEMPKSAIINLEDELQKVCNEIAYPLVIKIASKHISHKSDSGGVIINIKDIEGARKAYSTIMRIYDDNNVPAEDRQVLIQKFYKGGVEIALGASYDEQFGYMVMVGSGGVLIEVLKDVIFTPIPIGKIEALEMLKSLKGYQLLTGFRGNKAVDVDIIADYIVRIATLVSNHPQIAELDINPLYSMSEGSVVIDVRMSLK